MDTFQPTPSVAAGDIARLVRREFAESEVEKALSILDGCGDHETDRVKAAAIKLAAGSLTALRSTVSLAAIDYRDVLASAEYPGYLLAGLAIYDLSPDERRRIVAEDWDQYSRWFDA